MGICKLLVAAAFAIAIPCSVGQAPSAAEPAAGKLAFDVASIRQNQTDALPEFNFPLGAGDVFRPTGGIFSATNLPLMTYIAFAYKMGVAPLAAMQHQLPKWVTEDKYDIQAKSEKPNMTKDDMRMMMRALLAERFKLVMRSETQQVSVFDLVLARPGKTGPRLLPHPADLPCSTNPSAQDAADAAPSPAVSLFPATCGGLLYMPTTAPNAVQVGGRNVGLDTILIGMSAWGELGRPLIDRTGLSGKFDFSFQWVRQSTDADATADASGPGFMTALTEELGLKLVSAKGPVTSLIIDHVERPTEN